MPQPYALLDTHAIQARAESAYRELSLSHSELELRLMLSIKLAQLDVRLAQLEQAQGPDLGVA